MPDYSKLKAVLEDAYRQSAEGKGAERHANGRDFDRQPIAEIGRMVGPGFSAGQVMKKAQEAVGMIARGDYRGAEAVLLGAVVYCAACVVLIRELNPVREPLPQTTRTPGFVTNTPRAGDPNDTRIQAAMKAVDQAVGNG
jgi:hypothetical protein